MDIGNRIAAALYAERAAALARREVSAPPAHDGYRLTAEDGERAQNDALVRSLVDRLERIYAFTTGDPDDADPRSDDPLSAREQAWLLDVYGIDADEDADRWELVMQALEGDALEVRHIGHRGARDEEWTTDGVVIVFTTGGPHVQVDTAAREAQAWGWFGAARVTRALSSDVVDMLEQWAGIDA